MALPATDTFDGTGALSASWTTTAGSFARSAGVVGSTDAANSLAYHNVDTYNDQQYAKGTISALDPNDYMGVATRCDATGDGYTLYTKDTTAFITRVDAGTEASTLDTDATTPYAVNDVIELRSDGSDHQAYVNGTIITGFIGSSDSTHSSGSAGLSGYFSGATSNLTDWEGGNITAGASITSVPATVARGETGVIIGISGASAAQGTATVTLGGESCTITTYPGASGNLLVTVPSDIDLLYATATHTFVYTDDDTTSDTSAAVPFTPASGRSYIALVSPVYSGDEYLAYGYEGTPAPVSTDQLEYPDVTTPDSITFTVNADSEWILDSMPTSTQTVTCQIIRAATSVRSASWTVTYLVSGGKISTDSLNLGLRLGL